MFEVDVFQGLYIIIVKASELFICREDIGLSLSGCNLAVVFWGRGSGGSVEFNPLMKNGYFG